MKEFRAVFIEKVERTKSVVSFRFKPEQPISFLAGQFLQFIFDETAPSNRNLNKYLSFSCRPGKEYIEVTKRISASDFSSRLLSLKKGDTVLLKGPIGHCAIDRVDGSYAFLIGGIGITPVISMIDDIVFKRLSSDIKLLYSNTSDEDVPFKRELDEWTKSCPNIKIVHTVANCPSGDPQYCIGMIDKEFVLRQIPDYKERIFYIFGPPKMVEAMKGICQEIGCLPETIRAEQFVGY